MKKIIKLTETQLHKIVKRVLTEQRAGIIQQQDTDFCLIVCDIKHAKYGSNGEMVKKIQHLLAANGFNEEFVGGGMESGCDAEWPVCDGKFRKHTKDAVEEFQTNNKLKPDGIVGPLTLKKMCEVLKSTNSLMKKPLCPDCKCDDIKQRPPRLDNEDLILPSPINDDIPGVGEYVPTGRDCATIISCIRTIRSGKHNYGQNEWDAFLKCIGKIHNKIFPPIDIPKIPKTGCKGCPKYVWGGYQVQGGGPEYWARRKRDQECLKNKCSIFTKDEKLYFNWIGIKNNKL